MTLRHLKIYIAVCKYGSITTAADRIFLAQPTVSLAIKELEEHYGIKFFDRISRKLYITEIGKNFLDYAIHIVTLFDEMERGIKDWDSIGRLRMGASITIGTYYLPKYISDFQQMNPNVSINVKIDNSESIEQKIIENELDFALIEGTVHNPSIESIEYMRDKLILVCGKKHPLLRCQPLKLDHIKKCDFILREQGSGTRELFDSKMLIHGIAINPVWESVSTQAIVEAVAAGLGISVLPYRLVETDLKNNRIERLVINELQLERHFYIIYHKNKFLTTSARQFIELCKKDKY